MVEEYLEKLEKYIPQSHLLEILNIDQSRIQLARQRQSQVWLRKVPDQWPIGFSTSLTHEQEKLPNPNYQEAFNDPVLMLFQQVRGACSVINSRSDAIPSIRANLGVGICLATLGLEQEVFPDKMPWFQGHLSREAIKQLSPDQIQIRGSFARGLEMIRFFRVALNDQIPIFCMDTQGPFDLAHLLAGDDLFLLMYDDPGLVHHLLSFCVELSIRCHHWMKSVIGEPLTAHHHSNGLFAPNMGIRICEDSSALLNKRDIENFVIPYMKRLAQHFEGAWVHYCGRNDGLTEAICACPEIHGINFGHLPNHKDTHDFEKDMELIYRSGKVYFGDWPRYPDESGEAYLRRIHRWSKCGCLICTGGIHAVGPHGFRTIEEAQDFWYNL